MMDRLDITVTSTTKIKIWIRMALASGARELTVEGLGYQP